MIELKNSIKERLNVEVDYVNVVPRYLDFYESQLSGKLNFITLEDEFVLDNINLLSLDNVYCLTREQEVKKLVDNILKILSGDKYEVL